jgi:hypothetical protein
MIISALLLVAAIYTRQSYALAAPLAIFVWLLTINWRQAFKFAAVVGGLSLGLFILLNALTHGGFFFNIVTANINEFSIDRLTWNLRRYRDAVPFLLFMGGIFIIFGYRRFHAWPLLTMYLVGSSISSLTIGKIGSNVNYFLELSAALCLIAGAVIAMCRRYQWLRAVIAACLALQVGHLITLSWGDYSEILHVRLELFDEIKELESIVAETEGPVLADEFMGLITLQGQPLFIQPFEITQLVNAGKLDQTPIVENINNKDFPAILVHHLPDYEIYKERWTPEMLEAIEQNYTLTHILADTHVYQVRGLQRYKLAEIQVCPNSSWKLPTSALLGIAWREDGIDFFGGGSGKSVPVYSVADGLLTRPADSSNIVVIQHDDPLRPGEKVWTIYADMIGASGIDSYIDEQFPPGSTDIPVVRGQLLGYQGDWGGRPYWPVWPHLYFTVVQAEKDGSFPEVLLKENTLDASAYLGILVDLNRSGTQVLKCLDEGG